MTEGTFGTFKLPEGVFDSWAPENVAPMVAFLARDEAAHISGQVFVVFGGTVQRMAPWPVAGQIAEERRWTPDELAVELEKLMPGLTASPPEFPDVGIPA
jgi:hypothetical protein